MSDAGLVALAKSELQRLGLASSADVDSGCVVRVEKANDLANIANAQAANANQQVTNYQANCVAISTRLAGLGINVPGAPTYYPGPPLTLQTEVDAERKAN